MREQKINEFFSAALHAVEGAGALIQETWQQSKQIYYKSAVNLVTTVDRQAEEHIVTLLQKRFPDHSILAEEKTTIVRFEGAYRWIIDPLDGTTNFAHAYPHFSVSVALEHEGKLF